jgi:hypothetical protein
MTNMDALLTLHDSLAYVRAPREPEGPTIIGQANLHSFQDVSILGTRFSAVSRFPRSAVGLTAGAANRTR